VGLRRPFKQDAPAGHHCSLRVSRSFPSRSLSCSLSPLSLPLSSRIPVSISSHRDASRSVRSNPLLSSSLLSFLSRQHNGGGSGCEIAAAESSSRRAFLKAGEQSDRESARGGIVNATRRGTPSRCSAAIEANRRGVEGNAEGGQENRSLARFHSTRSERK